MIHSVTSSRVWRVHCATRFVDPLPVPACLTFVRVEVSKWPSPYCSQCDPPTCHEVGSSRYNRCYAVGCLIAVCGAVRDSVQQMFIAHASDTHFPMQRNNHCAGTISAIPLSLDLTSLTPHNRQAALSKDKLRKPCLKSTARGGDCADIYYTDYRMNTYVMQYSTPGGILSPSVSLAKLCPRSSASTNW